MTSEGTAMNINVSAWSIRTPVPSVLLFIMLTVVGVMGFRAMKVQQFPDLVLPTITVHVKDDGAEVLAGELLPIRGQLLAQIKQVEAWNQPGCVGGVRDAQAIGGGFGRRLQAVRAAIAVEIQRYVATPCH